MLTLGILALTIGGFLVLLDRKDKRLHGLLRERDELAQQREAGHRAEVATLLQRIQAPQVAVMEHSTDRHTGSPGMTAPMSDHEAAKQEEWQQVVAEMERVENEALESRLM